MQFNHKTSNTSFRLLAAQLHRTKSMTMSLGLLLIATLALYCFSTIAFNSVIAQPTASQFTIAKESSMALLNNVKRYLPDVPVCWW